MQSSSFSDYLAERRTLLRKLSYWRVAAFLFLIIGLILSGLRIFGPEGAGIHTPHIARVAVDGIITGDEDTLKLIQKIGDSKSAEAVLVTIDSPGGTTSGAERLYDGLRRLSAKKPTVAVVGTIAASGGYIAAIGADRIVALGNSLVGSVGVLVQYPDFSKLLENIGVKVEDVKSSPLKATPNPFEPTSPEARAALESLVSDSYSWFKTLVKDRRAMSDPQLASVADGRVFTGRQALDLHLIDEIGGEREAIAWLAKEKNISSNLRVQDWKPEKTLERWGIFSFVAAAADLAGLSRIRIALNQLAGAAEERMLDGLLSIWQAPASN